MHDVSLGEKEGLTISLVLQPYGPSSNKLYFCILCPLCWNKGVIRMFGFPMKNKQEDVSLEA